MTGKRVGIILLVAIVVAFPVLMCVPSIVLIPIVVSFGWINFLKRVGPQVEINWSGIATATVCVALLGYIIHRLGAWAATWPTETRIAWRWTKAPLVVAGVVLLFWAGLFGVGLIRSTQWLLSMDEPLTQDRSPIRIQSQSNLKQMALGTYNYDDTWKKPLLGATFDVRGQALHGWQTMLLPFVEEDQLYLKIRLDLPWKHESNQKHFEQRIRIYENWYYGPSTSKFAVSHYTGNVHVLGASSRRLVTDLPDGASNTLLMGEVSDGFVPWGQPGNWRDPALGLNRGRTTFGSPFAGRIHFALADGSVRFISDKIGLETLKALATPAGGEQIDDPEW